jgi:cytochrome bd ubiquinol oxidase subunit II
MPFELMLAGMLVGALTLYLLFGGADFGAGIWMLCTRGIEGAAQRALIDRAIGPIWEANHVWLIIAVTIVFTAFPRAFSLIATRLHIPLTVMLIAIVLRGAAFAVRTHDVPPLPHHHSETPHILRSIFASSSLVAPAMLGLTLGAIASGRLLGSSGSFHDTFVEPWLALFPLIVGLLVAALAAYLAAVYLIIESPLPSLKVAFRRRAVASWILVAVLGVGALLAAEEGAPEIYGGLTGTRWGLTTLLLALAINVAGLLSLLSGRDYLARFLAASGAAAMVWGWAFAQYPYLVEPTVTIYDDAAPSATLSLLLLSLFAGSVMLFPFLIYLYRIFKGHVLTPAE